MMPREPEIALMLRFASVSVVNIVGTAIPLLALIFAVTTFVRQERGKRLAYSVEVFSPDPDEPVNWWMVLRVSHGGTQPIHRTDVDDAWLEIQFPNGIQLLAAYPPEIVLPSRTMGGARIDGQNVKVYLPFPFNKTDSFYIWACFTGEVMTTRGKLLTPNVYAPLGKVKRKPGPEKRRLQRRATITVITCLLAAFGAASLYGRSSQTIVEGHIPFFDGVYPPPARCLRSASEIAHTPVAGPSVHVAGILLLYDSREECYAAWPAVKWPGSVPDAKVALSITRDDTTIRRRAVRATTNLLGPMADEVNGCELRATATITYATGVVQTPTVSSPCP
jgi:hypothetical protein